MNCPLWNHTLGGMLSISMFSNRCHWPSAICLSRTCDYLVLVTMLAKEETTIAL